MSNSTWNATGLFIVTASDTVICKLTPAGEPYAVLIAAAPELLAERNRLKAANAALAAALKDCLTFLDHDCCCDNSQPELGQASAALEKHNKEAA